MIKEVDDALIGALKNGLSNLAPAECIVLGEVDTKESKCIALENADFSIQETGIGGSAGEQMEVVSEKIEPDGSSREFNLSGNPLRPIIGVERPIGTIMSEGDLDSYRIDYEKNRILFYLPPPKGESILVRYRVARSIAEIHTLKLALTYYLTIWANDPHDREKITIEAIKTLYRQVTDLKGKGIDEIELVRGQLVDLQGDQNKKARRIEYRVKADITIERSLLPIKKIEIKEI
jgi:hypothetical protein